MTVQVLRYNSKSLTTSNPIGYWIFVVASMIPLVYLFTYYPLYFLNQKFGFTSNYMENYVFLASFLPWLLVALFGPFSEERTSLKFIQKIWKPIYTWNVLGWNVDSIGDVLVILFVIVSNLVWWLTPLIVNATQKSLSVKNVLDQLAATAGLVGMNNVSCTIFFAIRENAVAKLWMGSHTQFHHTTKYHVMFAYVSIGFFSIHSLYYPITYLRDQVFAENIFPWVSYDGAINFAGVVAWLCLVLIAVTGYIRGRKGNYQMFYWTHQLYMVFFITAFIHYYLTWYPVLGMLVYMVYDRMVGYSKFPRHSKALITKVSDSIVRIDIPVGMYGPAFPSKAGDWIKITIPQISYWNAHTFSIANTETQFDTVSVYVKAKGDWTGQLLRLAETTRVVPVRVQGPFGTGQSNFMQHNEMVFITAGTGMAALIPFLSKYISENKNVLVIWGVKKKQDVLAFTEFLDLFQDKNTVKHINVSIYVTESMEVWEKDSDKDTVISVTHSPERNSTNLNNVYSQNMIALLIFGTCIAY